LKNVNFCCKVHGFFFFKKRTKNFKECQLSTFILDQDPYFVENLTLYILELHVPSPPSNSPWTLEFKCLQSFVLNPFPSYRTFRGGLGTCSAFPLPRTFEFKFLQSFVFCLCLFVLLFPSFVLNPFPSYRTFKVGGLETCSAPSLPRTFEVKFLQSFVFLLCLTHFRVVKH
jgi:hypothetical protein